ncbi:hypothetical protein [Micromonospora coxensis]|uniref:Uncharacterized protein n=1 Tax=Micromonospora coxensis TaxID=356852 RepID=A0A1C5IX45_9ACTN|nr:hypothetical protein [Micromonospora coxensis]SCG62509.1 hypothetical protein GA0070614_3510 [Micromonospora coxensis]
MTDAHEDRAAGEPPGPDVPTAGAEPGAARRGPAWLVLGVVAAALLVCCCSTVVGLALAWSAGLFDTG